jgi:hypothetical protein
MQIVIANYVNAGGPADGYYRAAACRSGSDDPTHLEGGPFGFVYCQYKDGDQWFDIYGADSIVLGPDFLNVIKLGQERASCSHPQDHYQAVVTYSAKDVAPYNR